LDSISLGFCVPSCCEHNVIRMPIGVQYFIWRARIRNSFRRLSVLFPERLDGIDGGRFLPLKMETHAPFRYAPRRRDPSFSFPEVIRQGMEDGPLRACLDSRARIEGEGKRSANTRMIPRRLKSFCRSVTTRADSSLWAVVTRRLDLRLQL
jgi:hypothetical protein